MNGSSEFVPTRFVPREQNVRAPIAHPRRGRANALIIRAQAGRTQHDQRFDRAASFADEAVNLEFGMQRVRLDLRKSSLHPANRTWIARLDRQSRGLNSHIFLLPAR